MSNSAWGDVNIKCDLFKLHHLCHNPKCKCQKQLTFTPREFQLEGSIFKNTIKNSQGD